MAWSWSHSAEAYDAVKQNIHKQDREWLEVVWAEWQAAVPTDSALGHEFDQEKYDEKLKEAKNLPSDVLAEQIWEKTEEYSTCDNGGWNAYCCPFGCLSHRVPMSDEEEDDDLDEDDLDDD